MKQKLIIRHFIIGLLVFLLSPLASGQEKPRKADDLVWLQGTVNMRLGGWFFSVLDGKSGKTLWGRSKHPIMQGNTVYFGGIHIYARELKTGKEKWRSQLGGEVIAADKDMVFFLDYRKLEPRKYVATIHALDARDGSPKWSRKMPGYYENEDATHCVACTADGNLIVFTGSFSAAYDKSNGKIIWKNQRPETSDSMDESDRAEAADGVVVAQTGALWSEISARNIKTGVQLWKISLATSGSISNRFDIDNGVLYFQPQAGSFSAFDIRTGRRLFDLPRIKATSFKVKDKILFYLSSIEQDPKAKYPLNTPIAALHAFDLSSRTPMWERQLGNWGEASVERVTENAVYVIASNRGDHSTAFCIVKKTGKIFWRNEAASAVEGTSRFMVTE